jgi:hypothetical protein
MNFGAKNPPHRQAENRYMKYLLAATLVGIFRKI